MDFKLSNYNIILTRYNSEEKIIYNTFTGAYGTISNKELKQITEALENNTILEQDFLDILIENGFLIDKTFDELDLLRYQVNETRYNSKKLSITIAPFSGCNFRCAYCFEKDRLNNSIKMDEETQNCFLNYIESVISNFEILSINWFGGEPSMALDVIENISKKLITLCDEKNLTYESTIITNGYILNRQIAELYQKCKIKKIQITIDGNKALHDARRVLINGNGTYDRIMENIIENIDYLPLIQLRINIDKTNSSSYKDVIKTLKDNGIYEKLMITLGKIYVDDSNNYSHEMCLTCNEFSNILMDFREQKSVLVAPKVSLLTCASEGRYNFVLDADGCLYKCWNEIGDKNYSFGNIKEGVIMKGIALKYLTHDITRDFECLKCKFLPICMGGCCGLKKESKECCVEKYNIERQMNYLLDVMDKAN